MKKSLTFILIMMLAVVISACNSTENITVPTGTPSPAETPSVTEAPEATEAPSVTEAPEATEALKVTEAPELTEAPALTEVPEITADPVIEPTAEPVVTDAPEPADDIVKVIPMKAEKEYTYLSDGQGRTAAELSYDLVSLPEEYGTKYPLLQKALDEFNVNNEGAMAANAELIAENLTDVDTDSDFFIPLFSYRFIRPVRSDDNIVSLLRITDNYFAVSSVIWYEGFNFNPSTGAEIGIADIVGDRTAFAEMLVQRLTDKYGDLFDIDHDTLVSSIDMLVENESMPFVIGYDGFTFYLKDMIIGGYMDTTYAVTISFNDAGASDAFAYDAQVSKCAGDYMIQLPFGYGADYMLNGTDSPAVNLMITGLDRQYGYFDKTGIFADFDTMSIEESIYGSRIVPYLVKYNGKFYMYIQYINDTDDEFLAVFKLSKGKFVRQNEDGPLIGFADNMLSVNPAEMEILSRNDLIGTTFEKAVYKVGKNGIPERVSKYLEFMSPISLTLGVPFEIGAIDPEIAFDTESEGTGEFDYELEFAAGDVLTAVYADGDHSECQIFCTNADGEWGTFTCRMSMINNMYVMDVFPDAPMAD